MAMNAGLGDAESLAKCLSEVTSEHHYVMPWCFFPCDRIDHENYHKTVCTVVSGSSKQQRSIKYRFATNHFVDEKSIALITISRKRCRQSISSIGIVAEVGMTKYLALTFSAPPYQIPVVAQSRLFSG